MSLKPGYKLTEVGVLPEEWGVKRLGELGTVVRGGSPRPAGDPRYFNGDFIPWLTVASLTNIPENQLFISDTLTKLTEEGSKHSRTLQKGLLVIVNSGAKTLGVTKVLSIACCANDGIAALVNQRNGDRRFLSYYLNSQIKRLREVVAAGNDQLNLNTGRIALIPVPFPSEAEQGAISEALSDVDALLGGLDRVIAKKRDLKQAVMQQLLTGQTRLPAFRPAQPEFVQTTIGIYPSDWELTELSTLVEWGRGIRYGIVQPGEYDLHGRYMIRGQDYSEVKGWANPSEIFRVSATIEERYRNARVKAGDLIMTIVGYCGHVEMIPEWLDGANLTQTTARIAIDSDKAISAFCKYMLLSPAGRNQVSANMKGAAQPGLNCGDIERFLLPLPSIPEQHAIAEVLTEMDAELAALEGLCEKVHGLKQAMMQELLTGKTRLV